MADDGEKRIIEIEYVVKVDDAITKTEEFEDRVRETIAQLQEAAQKSKLSIDSLAKGMAKSFEEQQKSAISDLQSKIASLKTSDLPAESKTSQIKAAQDEIKQRTAAYQEYNRVVREALARVEAAEKASSNVIKAIDKETLEQKKANLREYNRAFNEYIKAQKTGGAMTPAAQAIGQEIATLKGEITTLASQTGKSFTQIGQDMLNKGQQPARLVKQAVSELNAEMKNVATSGGGGFLGFLQSLGTVGQAIFGFTLGTLAVQTLRNVTNWFKEAAAAGFEYAQALLRLEASTQILQESGMNITMKETLDLVNQLNKEFPIFTRKQVVEGVGYIQLLSQNLTLTNEQMRNLAEVGGALAVVLGKDLNEASKELALFLSSGYGEALQRAGILASKASVQHELLAMGVKTGYNETDAATRAQAGYNVIMQQSSKILEKALEMQNENAFAAIKSKNAWQQLKDTIGIRLTPVLTILYKASVKVAEGLLAMNRKWIEFGANLNAGITTIIPRAIEGFKFLSEAAKNVFNPEYNFDKAFDEYMKRVEEIYNLKLQKNLQVALPDIFTGFEDSAVGAGSAVSDAAATIETAVEDLYKRITDEQERFASDMLRLETDLQRDLEQLDIDANRKRGESWLDYFADMSAIWRKSYDDIVGENIKFQLDLAQISREYNQKRADAEQKYRDREQKAERDFQEKLRRLREEFLFDLEDALRERDARQVLRLIRRFNLEQDRLNRERAAEREDQQREYQRELEDIDQQRAERLQKLNEEHQARLAEIKRQEAIELRELQIKHEAELAEIDRRLAQEKADREARFLQQQDDLKTQFADRIKQIGEGLVEEYGVTKEMLDAIGAAYMTTYGPNGVMQQAIDYAMAYLRQAIITMNSVAAGFGGYGAPPPSGNFGTGFNGIPGYATGAKDMLVTSPTMIKVGEVPEKLNITPVNRLSSSDMGSKDGTITVELLLSPDLQARVIDNTMTEVANVMLDIQRRR